MPISINNASMDTAGYVNAQTVEDEQAKESPAGVANTFSPQANQVAPHSSSVEGVSSLNVGASRATQFAQQGALVSSVPMLPYQQVTKADAPTAQQLTSVVADMNLSSVTAFRIMQQAGQKAYDLDSTIGRAANKSVTLAKLQQLTDLKSQIDGERQSAKTQLAFSLLGAGAGIGMGVAGNMLRGKSASKNSALDVDKKISSNTALPNANDENIKQFVQHYRTARETAINRKNDVKAANANTTDHRASDLHFDDPGHKQFHDYKQHLRDQGHLKAHSDKLPDEEWAAGKFFAERQKTSKFPGTNGPESTFLQRIMHHDQGKASIGAGIDGGAQGVQQSISAFGTVIDTLHGGKYDADQAKLAQKQDEVQVSLAQQVADQAKSNKDRDSKQISDNLDAIKEVATRYASVIDKLT